MHIRLCTASRCEWFALAILSADATHGIVHDIKEKLAIDTKELHLLGDGTQAKPFIHVSDAVDGILHAISKTTEQYNVIQVGNEQQITMRRVGADEPEYKNSI